MTTKPASINELAIYEGATFRWTFQWLVDGVPVDLNGATVCFACYRNYGEPNIFDTPTTAIGTVFNAVNGEIRIEISDADTAAALAGFIKIQKYRFDLEVILANGDHCSVVDGQIQLVPRGC